MNTLSLNHYKKLNVDNKGRISLGKLLHEDITGFRAFWDNGERLILEPLTEISTREKWLFENPELVKTIEQAHKQKQKSTLHDLGSFKKYLNQDDS